MSAIHSTTPAQSAGVYIGVHSLPPHLTEKVYNSQTNQRFADLQSYRLQDFFSKENIQKNGLDIFKWGAAGKQLAKGLWSKASAYKEAYDYYRYSKKLQSHFDANYAPYESMRMIYNARGRDELPSPDNLARVEGGAVSDDEAVNNAYDYSGYIFDFFKEHLGYVVPQPMLQIVNYNDNSLRTGFDNAFFNPIGIGLDMMVYGTGDGVFFKSLDRDITVIAHELAHSYLSNIYPGKFSYFGYHHGQPGAINEHIADVIAKCVEAEYKYWDHGVENWLIGADIMVNPDFALRDMLLPGTAYSDPRLGEDPQPAHMKDFIVTDDDAGGVHLNNGILNRLFAEFSENVGGAVYDVPLKVWLKGIEICKMNPSFYDFANALYLAAQSFEVEDEFLAAAKATGVLEYDIVGGAVRKLPDVDDDSSDGDLRRVS